MGWILSGNRVTLLFDGTMKMWLRKLIVEVNDNVGADDRTG